MRSIVLIFIYSVVLIAQVVLRRNAVVGSAVRLHKVKVGVTGSEVATPWSLSRVLHLPFLMNAFGGGWP